ncbi:hypothetical protein Back2_28990 [Nocardioides baekrokdamisoli]|uniref:Uncharacterized protein n=1 Tax=Nocardioides baekrokdamisoli TaxID=1804624 RepID=A0A3G9IKB5_9ACTN|nr:DUF1295 domain-containing protein [Nocardioides baekrokdamisoli]BBH18612.1 hypothetical protein Back2_28990 [Nocardioides baekrokdamisoli]
MSKTDAMVRVSIAYVIAFLAFATWLGWGPRTGHLWLDGLLADLLATVIVFVASRWHHNSSFYDAYWSVLPPALAIGWWLRVDAPADDVRAWLALGVIALWSIRLTGNWAYGFPGLHHEDWRYPVVRERAGRFEMPVDLLAIHVVPDPPGLRRHVADLPAAGPPEPLGRVDRRDRGPRRRCCRRTRIRR